MIWSLVGLREGCSQTADDLLKGFRVLWFGEIEVSFRILGLRRAGMLGRGGGGGGAPMF